MQPQSLLDTVGVRRGNPTTLSRSQGLFLHCSQQASNPVGITTRGAVGEPEGLGLIPDRHKP